MCRESLARSRWCAPVIGCFLLSSAVNAAPQDKCKGALPPVFVTDIQTDTIYKGRDFDEDRSFDENHGPVSDLHAFYDSNHALAAIPLDFPSCITASEDDYLYVGDSQLDFVLAVEDLNDDNDCYDVVNSVPEVLVYFDGSGGGAWGGNAAGLRLESPNGVSTKLLTVIWVANSNTSAAGHDSIVRLEDHDGDLTANSLASEAVEYFVPAAGQPAITHSVPSALALGADGHVYYVENGTGIAQGIYHLFDANGSGVIENGPTEVVPFFLPTLADLVSEGVAAPAPMDLTSLESLVHEDHGHSGPGRKHMEEWFLTDLGNDVIWVLEDADGDGSIAYALGEAHLYWRATVTQPSAVRDITIDECEQLIAAQPEAPSDRLHLMVDWSRDEKIQDGSSEIENVYDDLIAPVDMETPYAIGGDFHLHAEVGASYCPGTVLTCTVCNNPGSSGEGCRNSTGFGAFVVGEGTASVTLDDLEFHCMNLPNNQAALLFVGTNAVNGGSGVPFGRGLRCAGGAVKRLQLEIAQNFEAMYGPGLGTQGGWIAGDTRYFQVWYRDPNDSPTCAAEFFNLSNGVQITFTP